MGRVFLHPVDDVVRGRAGAEDALEAELLELLDVVVGDDAAAEEDDVVHAALLELLDDAREELEVRAGEDGEADDVGVFLEGGLGDHLGGLADAGVDDLEAGVAEGAGDDLGAAVVAVEAGLGDDDLEFAFGSHSRSIIAGEMWLFGVQRREQRPRVAHADAVAERLEERDGLLEVLARLVALLAFDEELGELELDLEAEALLIRRQVIAEIGEGIPGDLRGLARAAEDKARVAHHYAERTLGFPGGDPRVDGCLVHRDKDLTRKNLVRWICA